MQLHNIVYIPESMQGRWAELVEQARADIGALADRFVQYVEQLDTYRDGAVSMDQVRLDALSSFGFLLGQIAGNDEFKSDVIWTARRLGRDRARIGIPLNDLLAAVRLDFKVLWEVFRSYAGPADRELLVAGVEKIWAAIERYSIEVQNGYLEESSQMADKRLSERARLMTAILNNDVPAEEDLQSLASALGVDAAGNFIVVATAVQGDRDLRKAGDRLTASGHMAHIHSTGHYSLLVSDWKGEDTQPIRKLLSGSVCGLAPVIRGFSGLARACRLAIEIVELNAAGAHGPAELKDLWLPFLASRLRDAAPELVQSVLAGLDTVSEAEQERLTEVAWAFARSGSISKTAAQMYCHRNTVLNRLRRLEELTGHDITVPADAALLLLAFLTSRPEAISN
ncbi:PucR family transcriptional regulator [Paenarthrobacter ureafaciens]|uniref:PucR family transcriptional regulator n=1 Tax=Paenarthrobacter ureafaciens TaxID=37931 RepID=UPI001C2C52E1|nr:PucR family transcriptional regulator [Paenarthrobacter ureafaciens]